MIGQECIDELADLVGLRAEIAAITERAMWGEIAFEPALRERISLLRGLPAESIATVLAERVTLMPGAATLVRTMRAHGAYTALISGGFTLFTREIAAMIGFGHPCCQCAHRRRRQIDGPHRRAGVGNLGEARSARSAY